MLAGRTRTPRLLTDEEVESFIAGHDWTFAKTYAETAPHSYVVKKRCRCPREFERFVMHISRAGYRGRFGRYYYTYLDWPVDGVMHCFWSMGEPLARTIIINRAVKTDAIRPVRPRMKKGEP
jgi:hypothetical protein